MFNIFVACHECYSLAGDKVDGLQTADEQLQSALTAIIDDKPGETSLTFTQDLVNISAQLSIITTEVSMH